MNLQEEQNLKLKLDELGLRSKAEQIINPPMPHIPSDREIELAKLKYVQEMLIDRIACVAYDDKEPYKYPTPEIIREQLQHIFRLELDEESSAKRFDEIGWTDCLSESHWGDCTAVACSCARCYAERLFGFDTAPRGKSVGSAMLRQWDKEFEMIQEYRKHKDWKYPFTLEQEIECRTILKDNLFFNFDKNKLEAFLKCL